MPAGRCDREEKGRSMLLDRYSGRIGQIGFASLAVLLLSGCTVMDAGGEKSLPLAGGEAIPAPNSPASVTMEIRPVGKKPELRQVQLDSGATVQQVLEKAKLVKRFRRMNIDVLRVTGEQRAKLDVKYDHTKAHVDPLYDYAVHPGDHLIVAEDPSTALDDMFKSLTNPLRSTSGSRPNYQTAM